MNASEQLYLVSAGNKKPAVMLSLPGDMTDEDWDTLYRIVRNQGRLKSRMQSLWFRAWPLRPTRRIGDAYWHREYDGKAGDMVTLLPAVSMDPKAIKATCLQLRVDMSNVTKVKVVQPSLLLSAESVLREWLLYRKDRADKESSQN